MSPPDSQEDLLAGVPCEELGAALRCGGDLEAWSPLFGRLAQRVSEALRRQFPGFDRAEDAAQSAIRSFLRRMRHGQLELRGPNLLAGLLIVIARNKAVNYLREARRQPGPLGARDVPKEGSTLTEDDPAARDRRQRQLRERMRTELADLLEGLKESLTTESHQAVLPYWFAEEYEGKKTTDDEIARILKVSRSTVERAKRSIRRNWKPLLEESRRALREFAHRLEGEGDAAQA